MMKRRIKQGGAMALAAALMFSAFALPDAYAALGVETDKECSVEVIAAHDQFSELQNLPITVKLYRVADIAVTGAYTATEAFAEVDFSDIDSDTVAAVWEEKAKLAKEIVDTKEIAADAEAVSEEGKAAFTALATGMYLVDAQPVDSDYNTYEFTPYLVSLPNNYYYGTGDDTWVYDLTVEDGNAIGLKPEKSDRYGDLIINKTLDVYNATNGGANFVFQVEATKTDVDTNEVKVVYSNVVALTFDGPGTNSVKIEKIPAGADVVVTEVYSGANYELTTEGEVTTVIIAEDVVNADFANTHNGGQNGGTGLVNTFTYNDGEWTHSASVDSRTE